jgi:hypothetical protein
MPAHQCRNVRVSALFERLDPTASLNGTISSPPAFRSSIVAQWRAAARKEPSVGGACQLQPA